MSRSCSEDRSLPARRACAQPSGMADLPGAGNLGHRSVLRGKPPAPVRRCRWATFASPMTGRSSWTGRGGREPRIRPRRSGPGQRAADPSPARQERRGLREGPVACERLPARRRVPVREHARRLRDASEKSSHFRPAGTASDEASASGSPASASFLRGACTVAVRSWQCVSRSASSRNASGKVDPADAASRRPLRVRPPEPSHDAGLALRAHRHGP